MEIKKILERIHLDSSKTYMPTLKTLRLLQKQYILNVPYENLDFALDRSFSVELGDVYDKIVNHNRGGICYESHTLFMYLLESLGFTAHFIFAKVEDLTYIGKDYPHLVIIVNINGIDYLVDVANGQNVREPMNINDSSFISIAEDNRYKIESNKVEYTLQSSYKNKDWFPRYYFTKEKKVKSDFKDVFENDTSESICGKIPLLVTLAKEDGRLTMQDEVIILRSSNEKRVWKISKDDRFEVLKKYFNMNIDY